MKLNGILVGLIMVSLFAAILYMMAATASKMESQNPQIVPTGIYLHGSQVYQVTIEGCEYFLMRELAHKGNCSNSIHYRNN